VAKIFDLHSFRKSKKGQSSSKNDPKPGRASGGPVQSIDSDKGAFGGSWLISSSRIAVNAGAGLLVAVGVLCGLYLGTHYKKSAVANPKPDENVQARAMPEASPSARPLAKPSPVIPVGAAQAGGAVVSKQAPVTVTNLPPIPVPRYTPVRFAATHKKVFGGCTGQLELTSARLHFSCPNQADLNFPVEEIARAHKDGVVLKTGEKYHFVLANHSKDQVEAIFLSWVNRVQQYPQQNRAAF
jgi:hypothetical protein